MFYFPLKVTQRCLPIEGGLLCHVGTASTTGRACLPQPSKKASALHLSQQRQKHAVTPLTNKESRSGPRTRALNKRGVVCCGICAVFAYHWDIYFKPLKVPSDGSWVDFDHILSQTQQVFNEGVFAAHPRRDGVTLEQILFRNICCPDSVSPGWHPGHRHF